MSTQYYVIVVEGMVEARLVGPYPDEEARDKEAWRQRGADDDLISIHWMDQAADGTLTMGDYSGGFMARDNPDYN